MQVKNYTNRTSRGTTGKDDYMNVARLIFNNWMLDPKNPEICLETRGQSGVDPQT
jgi:hypothetical protein